MAQAARLNLRMQKELNLLLTDPPPGVSLSTLSDDTQPNLSIIHAQIQGPEETVYANGVFHIKIQIPDRYPFQPPNVTFATPIYHPNIDTGGRICLDILNLPPKGAWQPSLNISTVLTSIGLLLTEPNPDDGLMCETSREYKYNRQTFDQKARSMTEKFAMDTSGGISSNGSATFYSSSSKKEGEGLERESRNVDAEENENHKKLTLVSRKLSLESSGPFHGRNNDCKIFTSYSDTSSVLHSQSLPPTSSKSLHTPVVDTQGGQPTHQDSTSINMSAENPYDIGHKLSLGSFTPPHSRDVDVKEHTVQARSFLSHSKTPCVTLPKSSPARTGNLIDQEPHSECEKNGSNGCIDRSPKNLFGICQKLSIRPSCSPQKQKRDEKENELRTQRLSLLQSKNLPLNSSNSFLMQKDHIYDRQQPHQVRNDTAETSTKTFGISQTVLMDVSDQFKTGDDNNKRNVSPDNKLTSKSHPVASTNSLDRPQTVKNEVQQSHSDRHLGAGNGSNHLGHKKLHVLGRKLSLASTAISRSRYNGDMENVLAKQKPLQQLQTLYVVSSKSLSISHDGEYAQPHQIHVGEVMNENIQKKEEASSIAEAVIVLDSEDSEEEAKVPLRSRLSISRNRLAGKRKVKA